MRRPIAIEFVSLDGVAELASQPGPNRRVDGSANPMRTLVAGGAIPTVRG